MKTAIGLLLIPLFTAFFLIDRAILIFLPHVEGVKIQRFMFDPKQIKFSMIRFVSALFVLFIIWLFL
jgi:hypothetical protein